MPCWRKSADQRRSMAPLAILIGSLVDRKNFLQNGSQSAPLVTPRKCWILLSCQRLLGGLSPKKSGFSSRCVRVHRHALMTCIACVYLQHPRLAEHRRTGREKMTTRFPGLPSPSLPAVRQAIAGRLFISLVPPVRCPLCHRRSSCLLTSKCQLVLIPKKFYWKL